MIKVKALIEIEFDSLSKDMVDALEMVNDRLKTIEYTIMRIEISEQV